MNSPWVIKIQRANELINELEMEIKEYFEITPPVVDLVKIKEPDLYAVVLAEEHPVSDRWSAITGDVVHNLRSSLDSLIFAIITKRAKESGKRIIEREICFPMVTSSLELRSQKRWHQSLGTEDLFQVIERHLPNHNDLELTPNDLDLANDNHQLMVLKDLSNDDKHRSTSVILCSLDFAGFALPEGLSVSDTVWNLAPWKVGQEIYQTRISGVTESKQPQLFAEFEVALERDATPSYAHSVVNRLKGISGAVEWCLSELTPFAI